MILEPEEYAQAELEQQGYCDSCNDLTAHEIPPHLEAVEHRICPRCACQSLHGVQASAALGMVQIRSAPRKRR